MIYLKLCADDGGVFSVGNNNKTSGIRIMQIILVFHLIANIGR